MSLKRLFSELLSVKVLYHSSRKKTERDTWTVSVIARSTFPYLRILLSTGDSISRVITYCIIQRNIRMREDGLKHKKGAVVLWVPVKEAPLWVLRSVTNMNKPDPLKTVCASPKADTRKPWPLRSESSVFCFPVIKIFPRLVSLLWQ